MKSEENPEPQEEYILGVDPVELQRLWTQHEVWAEDMRRLLGRAGLGTGSTWKHEATLEIFRRAINRDSVGFPLCDSTRKR